MTETTPVRRTGGAGAHQPFGEEFAAWYRQRYDSVGSRMQLELHPLPAQLGPSHIKQIMNYLQWRSWPQQGFSANPKRSRAAVKLNLVQRTRLSFRGCPSGNDAVQMRTWQPQMDSGALCTRTPCRRRFTTVA